MPLRGVHGGLSIAGFWSIMKRQVRMLLTRLSTNLHSRSIRGVARTLAIVALLFVSVLIGGADAFADEGDTHYQDPTNPYGSPDMDSAYQPQADFIEPQEVKVNGIIGRPPSQHSIAQQPPPSICSGPNCINSNGNGNNTCTTCSSSGRGGGGGGGLFGGKGLGGLGGLFGGKGGGGGFFGFIKNLLGRRLAGGGGGLGGGGGGGGCSGPNCPVT